MESYRQRVEAVVCREGKVLTGLYPDGSIALPGGGIAGGQSLADAAVREVMEETGIRAVSGSVRQLPQVFKHDWSAPKLQADRQQYVGSETRWAAIYSSLGEFKVGDVWEVTDVEWRTPQECVRIMMAVPMPAGIHSARLQAIVEACSR